jgi:hypothetical protein
MNPDDDALFRELEAAMIAAHEGVPDVGAIARLYADDFFSTNADGRVVNKAEWLDVLRHGCFVVDRISASDFKVRRFGSVAVVTGRSRYLRDGQQIGDVRHTQVWAHVDGRWQLTTWHGTPVMTESS